MRYQILYLDANKARAVVKALGKYGEVSAAADINQALYLIAEKDFDYYFVCADTPQAQAFLKHLRHDPQLSPPSGVVLLTDNLEEDCTAWSVNTFITLSRIKEDIPYVFSHMKREPAIPTNVLTIAPTAAADETSEEELLEGGWSSLEGSKDEKHAEKHEVDPFIDKHQQPDDGKYKNPDQGGGTLLSSVRGRYKSILALALLSAVVAWLFAWGPLSARQDEHLSTGEDKVLAEAINVQKHVSPLGDEPYPYSASRLSAYQSSPDAGSPSSSPVPGSPVELDEGSLPSSQNDTTTDNAVKSPSQPNRPPSATLTGPSQVMARQSASYSASGSDPDGDSITFSWGSSTVIRCWSTPGLYSVCVTVTDSRGASATASMSVRVI